MSDSTETPEDQDTEGSQADEIVTPLINSEKVFIRGVEMLAKTEKAGLGVDAVVAAIRTERYLPPLAPFIAAFNASPASAQRLIGRSGFGKLMAEYAPMLDPMSYFVPGVLASIMALLGCFKFKLTEDEELALNNQFGGAPTPEQRATFTAAVSEGIIKNIALPGNGYAGLLSSGPAKAASTVEKPLGIVTKVAGGMAVLEGARDSYFAKVREGIYARDLAEAHEATLKSQAEVAATTEQEHAAVAEDVKPQVQMVQAAPDTTEAANTNELYSKAA